SSTHQDHKNIKDSKQCLLRRESLLNLSSLSSVYTRMTPSATKAMVMTPYPYYKAKDHQVSISLSKEHPKLKLPYGSNAQLGTPLKRTKNNNLLLSGAT
ncbi:hypothetical protein HAX54_052006, partial [Datura stramonium]|nr:hypothetical protein [Datura stramonium]